MNVLRSLCVIGISLTSLMVVGCGSDDNNNGGDANAKAFVASCERLCSAKAAKSCDNGLIMTESECKEICQALSSITGDCAAKYKTYGECTDKAADPCEAETTCTAEIEAAAKTCGFTK